MSDFLCGAAREIITPPIGTHLYGYNPFTLSESIHDDLTVTALALGDGHITALLISLTLGDMNTKLCADLQSMLSETTGVPKDNIILASTHTHSAPNVSGVDGWGDIDYPFVTGILIPSLKKASSEAIASMAGAEVGVAEGQSFVGINRRQQLENGAVALGQNPWGTFDPTMTVMCFRNRQTKQGIFNLIHYSCHGTAAGNNHEITRDWSGVMIDSVEKQTHILTGFYNGSIGDSGPRLTNGLTVGDITYVEELGSYASLDAIRILRQIRSYTQPEFSLRSDDVHLPYQSYPNPESVRTELAAIKEPEKLINVEKLYWKHLSDLNELLTNNPNPSLPDDFTYRQTQIIIGDSVFIPAPFELFSETALRLRAYSGKAHTMTLSCSNGYEGYLPSKDQLALGGYEIDVFKYASVNSLSNDTDQNLISESLRILRNN